MYVGVVKETYPGERRVAITPGMVGALGKIGLELIVQSDAGLNAGFTDEDFRAAGATIETSRSNVWATADIMAQVRTLGANPEAGAADLPLHRQGQILLGHAEPLTDVAPLKLLADTGVISFAMELIPRITRAQSMDVLSSQATIAGYRAVLLAMEHLPKMCPMMMTAAGTLAPAKIFVIGAGVAGLQAIATARRNGAVVSAYDIRPVVKEQVESLGARFVEIQLDAAASEDKGGYAKAMDDEFYRKQQEMMTTVIADSDVVITTAAVPGKKAPILVTSSMVAGMRTGSVIVDIAAERGGNVECTVPEAVTDVDGVTVVGTTNLPSAVPFHASQMYARNLVTFLKNMLNDDGRPDPAKDDEIVDGTLLTRDGEIVHRRVRDILGLSDPDAITAPTPTEPEGGSGE